MSTPKTNFPATNAGSSRGTFRNQNLNATLKAPQPLLPRPAGGLGRGSLVVISSSIKKAVLKVAAAPSPANTPSLRRENKGKDITVNLVPLGSGTNVWGQSSGDSKNSETGHDEHQSNSGQQPSAPWTKSSTDTNETSTQAPKPQIRDWADVDSDEEEDEIEEKKEPSKLISESTKFQSIPVHSSNNTSYQTSPTLVSANSHQYRERPAIDDQPRASREPNWRTSERSLEPPVPAKEREPSWRTELRPQTGSGALSPREMFPSSSLSSTSGGYGNVSTGGGFGNSFQGNRYSSPMGGDGGYSRRPYASSDFRGDNRYTRDDGGVPPLGPGTSQYRPYEYRDNRDRESRRGYSQFDHGEGRRSYNNYNSYDQSGGGNSSYQPARGFSSHYQSNQQPFQSNFNTFRPNFDRYDSRSGPDNRYEYQRPRVHSASSTAPYTGRSEEREPSTADWRGSTAPPVSSTQSSSAVPPPGISQEQIAEQRLQEQARQEREQLEIRKRQMEERQKERERQEEARRKELERAEELRREQEQRREWEREREKESERERERERLEREREEEERLKEQERRLEELRQEQEMRRHQYEERPGGRQGFRSDDRERDRDRGSDGIWTRRPVATPAQRVNDTSDRTSSTDAYRQDVTRDVEKSRLHSANKAAILSASAVVPKWQSEPLPNKSLPTPQPARPQRIVPESKTYASLFPRPAASEEDNAADIELDIEKQTSEAKPVEPIPRGQSTQKSAFLAKQLSKWSKYQDRPSSSDHDDRVTHDSPSNAEEYSGSHTKYQKPSHVIGRNENANRRVLYDPKTDKFVKPSQVAEDPESEASDQKKAPKRRLDTDDVEAEPSAGPSSPASHQKHEPQSAYANPWKKSDPRFGNSDRVTARSKDVDSVGKDKDSRVKEKENLEYEEAVKRRREETRRDNDEAREKHLKARQRELEQRAEARSKERAERPPRTKGVLFRFTETGELEQVLSPSELAERAVKREQYEESQKALMEKMSLRENERRERDAQRRAEKAERKERERSQVEANESRIKRTTEEKESPAEEVTPVSSTKRRGKSAPPPVVEPAEAVFVDSEFDYDGVLDDLNELDIEFTEVKRRRVKLQEKKGQRDSSYETASATRLTKIAKRDKLKDKGSKARKEGGEAKDDSKWPSEETRPTPVVAHPARPAWNDPQATLEVLGVLPPPPPPPEPEVGNLNKVVGGDAKTERRGRGRRDREREKDGERKERSEEKRKPNKILTSAIQSALNQSPPTPPPASASQASDSTLIQAVDQPVQTLDPVLDSVVPVVQPSSFSLPGQAQQLSAVPPAAPQPSPPMTLAPASAPERDRYDPYRADDETNMDIQSMAIEASVTRRNPMSYPTFIPGVGLSTVDIPQDRWPQQQQLRQQDNSEQRSNNSYGMLLQMPLNENQLAETVAWQNQQSQAGNINIYGNQGGPDLNVGGWGLGGFAGFMQPIMSNAGSGNNSWNYEQSYQNNEGDPDIFRTAQYLGQGAVNVAPLNSVSTQWGGQFGADGSVLKDGGLRSDASSFLSLGASTMQFANFGYGMGDIRMPAGEMTIESTPMTRDMNALLMVDNKVEEAEGYVEGSHEEKRAPGDEAARGRGRSRGGRRGGRGGRGGDGSGAARGSGGKFGGRGRRRGDRENRNEQHLQGQEHGQYTAGDRVYHHDRGDRANNAARLEASNEKEDREPTRVRSERSTTNQNHNPTGAESGEKQEHRRERSTRLRRRPDQEIEEGERAPGTEGRPRRAGHGRGYGRGGEKAADDRAGVDGDNARKQGRHGGSADGGVAGRAFADIKSRRPDRANSRRPQVSDSAPHAEAQPTA